ncbi:MAG: hypothetical protein H7069_11675 [Phormidesmis sp. FL-bin-119]|nr:hypothetical protein [Pedobacter sp.]
MVKKLRLKLTDSYEQAIAGYEISKMLCAFVEGRPHVLNIGAEQGGITGWDDFVMEDAPNEFTHLQVKRQQTDFKPSGKSERDLKIDLSPLDKSMLSLAEWFEKPKAERDAPHRFRIEIPGLDINVKQEIELRQLRDFVDMCIKATTTVQGLTNLQNVAKDGGAINIFLWLTTWCGFKNWGHILEAFQSLEIRDNGLAGDVDAKSFVELERHFTSPKAVLTKIKSYLDENSSYSGQIAPRQLLCELVDQLLPQSSSWTQLVYTADGWEISGTHDLQKNEHVERPSIIVPELWANDRQRSLFVNVTPVANILTPLHEGVFQLALHLNGNSSGAVAEWAGWKSCIEAKVGFTLGLERNDLESLTISANIHPFKISQGKIMATIGERETYAKEIVNQMTKTTWEMVCIKVVDQIERMETCQSSQLRDAVELRWREWEKVMKADTAFQKKLFSSILHPKAEGDDILGQLRVGPKTKYLLAEAIFLSLLVSVGLDEGDRGVMMAGEGLSIRAIGLAYWSGPHGGKRIVCQIDDDDVVETLIGRESADILILAKSTDGENMLYKQPLTESKPDDHSLAAAHRPKLLITKNKIFKAAVKKGTIADLRNYLEKNLMGRTESLSETLNLMS